MTEYKDFYKIFAERTKANLEFIEQSKSSGESVFETTQLINSLLGMIVFLRESDRINGSILDKKWKIIQYKEIQDHHNYCKKFSNFIRKFRNALAHGHIDPQIDENQEVSKFILWDECRCGNLDWKIEIDLENIKKLAYFIQENMHQFPRPRPERRR